MSLNHNKQIVKSFVEAINAQEWDRMDVLVASEFKRHSFAAGEPKVDSRALLKQYLIQEFETFPDAKEEIEDLIAEGDKVAVRHRFRGTQDGPLGKYPATGKVMESTYIAIYRIEAGKIVEAWAEWDTLSGLVQLGHWDSEPV